MVASRPCKIRITKELTEIFPQYRPKVGKVYAAEYVESGYKSRVFAPVCVVSISGKRIVVRKNEFELVR